MAALPRWARRSLAGLVLGPLGLVLLAAAVVVALTQTPTGRALVLERVLAALNTSVFAATLSADRLSGPMFGRLALEGVRLDMSAQGAEPPLATLERVDVSYDVRALVRGEVVLTELAIDGLEVVGTLSADGAMDLASVLRPTEPSAPEDDAEGIALRFDNVSLRRSSFLLRDARGASDAAPSTTVAATAIEGALSFALAPSGDIEVRVRSLATTVSLPNWVDRQWALRTTDVRFASEGERLDVAVAEVHLDDAELIGFDGTVTLAPESSELPFAFVDLSFPRFALAPDELNGALGQEVLLAPIRFGARVAGPPGAVRVDLPVDGPEGRVELGMTFDVRTLTSPTYEGVIRLVRVRPGEWLSLGTLDADVSAGLYLRGAGLQPDTAELTARLEVGPSRVGPLRIDEAFVSAQWADQTVTLSSLQLRSRGAELQGQGMATLAGAFELDASLDVPDLAATLVGVQETFATDPVPDATGAVALALQAEGALPLDAWQTDGLPASLEGWSAALSAVTASMALTADGLELDGIQVGTLRASVEAQAVDAAAEVSAQIRIRNATLPGADAQPPLRIPSASADLRWADDAVTASISASIPSLVGEAAASFSVRDTDAGLRARISALRAQPLGIDVRLDAPATLDLAHERWRPTEVRIRGVQARLDNAAIALDAEVGLAADGAIEAVQASGRFDAVDVAQWAARLGLVLPVPVTTTLSGTLRLEGVPSAPRVDLSLEAPSVGVEGIPPFALAAEARVAGGRATGALRATPLAPGAPSLSLADVDVPLRLSLMPFSVALDPDAGWAAVFDVSSFPLALVEAVVPDLASYGLEGAVVMAGELGGTPAQPSMDGTITGEEVALVVPWGTEGVAFDALDFALDAEVRSVEDAMAQVDVTLSTSWQGQPLVSAMLDGTLDIGALLDGAYDPRAQPLRASVSLEPFDLMRLPEPMRAAVGADAAIVQGAIAWNGTLEDPGVKLTLLGDALQVGAFGPFRVVARAVAADRIEIGALLYEGEESQPLVSLGATHAQTFASALTDGVDLDAALEVNAALSALPAASLAPLVPALADETAVASGTLRVDGSLGVPRVDGSVSLRGVQLVGGGVGDLIAEVMVGSAATEVALTMLVEQMPVLTVDAAVTIPSAADGARIAPTAWPLSAQLRATEAPLEQVVPALLAADFLEAITGLLDADITIDGTVGAPSFSGSLVLEDAGASVIPLGRTFEGVRLAARVDDTGLVIDEIRLGDTDGFVTGTGRVILDGLALERYSLGFRFRDLFVADPGGQGVNLRGVVDVEGRLSDTLHDVDVVLRGMRVTVPDNSGAVSAGPTRLPDYIHFVDEDVAASEIGQALPRLLNEVERDATPSTALRVHVTTTGNNELRHPLIEVAFEADVVLDIDGPQTRTSGQVTILSGGLSVASNRFEIERGFVRFTEAADAFDPMIDVVAVHALAPDVTERVAAVYGPPSGEVATIRVTVTGLVSDLTANIEEAIRLSSDPGMNRQDIFQVLATGRLSGSGDSSEAQEGVAALSGLLIGLVSDRIRETLFIDTLRIEGTSESQRIEGGKYIADNLYVSGTYIRTPDQEDDNNFEVALQWILREIGPGSLRFELRGGDRAKGGLELLYQVVRRSRSPE